LRTALTFLVISFLSILSVYLASELAAARDEIRKLEGAYAGLADACGPLITGEDWEKK